MIYLVVVKMRQILITVLKNERKPKDIIENLYQNATIPT